MNYGMTRRMSRGSLSPEGRDYRNLTPKPALDRARSEPLQRPDNRGWAEGWLGWNK